jgi:hypothetical protein
MHIIGVIQVSLKFIQSDNRASDSKIFYKCIIYFRNKTCLEIMINGFYINSNCIAFHLIIACRGDVDCRT